MQVLQEWFPCYQHSCRARASMCIQTSVFGSFQMLFAGMIEHLSSQSVICLPHSLHAEALHSQTTASYVFHELHFHFLMVKSC